MWQINNIILVSPEMGCVNISFKTPNGKTHTQKHTYTYSQDGVFVGLIFYEEIKVG
jgi:hypothetical protein